MEVTVFSFAGTIASNKEVETVFSFADTIASNKEVETLLPQGLLEYNYCQR